MITVPLLLGEITLVFGIALLVARLASRARAAVRHLVLAGAFGVALVLPLATLVSPTLAIEFAALPARAAERATRETMVADPIPAVPADLAVAADAAVAADRAVTLDLPITAGSPPASASAPTGAQPILRRASDPVTLFSPTPPLTRWLLLAWAIGALLALTPVCVSLWRLHVIRRGGAPWPAGRNWLARLASTSRARQPQVLLHADLAAPITNGLLRPVIILPAAAADWSEVHLANALLHELEHVRRHDWAVHLATRTVCALYWFHPLSWIAWRALRLEAERACDDAVLAQQDAAPYAAQLLELARRFAKRAALPGLQMASRSDLSLRITAVLDGTRPRGRAGRKATAGIALVALVLIAMLAPLRVVGPVHANEAVAPPRLVAAAPLRNVGPRQTPLRINPAPPALPADSPLAYTGIIFSGGEDPHAYGPRIELCRQDGQWIGFVSEFTGLPANPPSARMQDLRLDERSGTLSFSAQLTIGVEPQAGGYAPATRLHEFSGRIDAATVKGRRRVRSLAPGAEVQSEEILLKRDPYNAARAGSCATWRDSWNSRPGIRDAVGTGAPAFDSPRALVADILEMVQSALADEATRALDEVRRPITGLRHIQRHAQAVLDDNGRDTAALAANYLEVINALANIADLAINVASRPPEAGLSPQRLRQLAARMREQNAALSAMLLPVLRSGGDPTPAHDAARVALDIALAARDDTRFVTATRHPWLYTELVTLERAARSCASDDGTDPQATLKLHLLGRSIQTTANQADQIAGRNNEPPDERRKATELAASLRNISGRLDGSYPAQGGQQVSFRVPGADIELLRITGDNQYDRQVTWDSARMVRRCDTDPCDEVRARGWWFKGKVIVEYRLRGDPALRSCHFYVNERQAGSQWVDLQAPARGITAITAPESGSGSQGRCLAAPAAAPVVEIP